MAVKKRKQAKSAKPPHPLNLWLPTPWGIFNGTLTVLWTVSSGTLTTFGLPHHDIGMVIGALA